MPENMTFYIWAVSSEEDVEASGIVWWDGEPDLAAWRVDARFQSNLTAASGVITIHGPFTVGAALI